jgi:hypothetical protein
MISHPKLFMTLLSAGDAAFACEDCFVYGLVEKLLFQRSEATMTAFVKSYATD